MFLFTDKNTFLAEAKKLNNNKLIIDELEMIYDHVKQFQTLEDPELAVKKVLKDMFIMPGMNDIVIPYSFYFTSVGKVIFSALYGINEQYNKNEIMYTITDVVGFTRTEKRPKGFSKQYLNKQINERKLIGVFRNNRWEFERKQVNDFLKLKGLKETGE